MSISIDELYQQLLDLGMSEQELETKVKNKVEEYGGFMSKQGVLFIIARENGLDLKSPDIVDYIYDELEEEVDYDELTIEISDLNEGMSNIVLLGKILKVNKAHEFIRKDETVGKVCSFLLGDPTGTVKVVLWDERVDNIKHEYFNPNKLVRIIGGYSKLGQNETLEVHIGRKGMLILSPDINCRKKEQFEAITITDLEEITFNTSLKPLKQVIQQTRYINVVKGIVKIEEFKELELKSGDKSFLLKMFLDADGYTIRVKAWGMKAVECLKVVKDGDFVSITNLTVKENKYTAEKELMLTKNSSLILI